MLILNLDLKENNLYARLVGKLTKKECYKFHEYIIPYLKRADIASFVCDCKDLRRIDGEGKYALLKTKVVMKQKEGTFLLQDVKKEIKNELLGYRMRITRKD